MHGGKHFGFETYDITLGKVEIKRTIPKGSAESKDFKTKKIFVGGIPTSMNEGDKWLRFLFINCFKLHVLYHTVVLNFSVFSSI